MTPQPNGASAASLQRLVVVRVEDAIEPKLTGRPGGCYESPPQPREQAMALVSLLLGCAIDLDGKRRWTAPVPGGKRVVTLTEETGR